MTGAVLREILRRIKSLSMSTDIDVMTSDFSISFRRLNSPYVSHENIIFGSGTDLAGITILSNTNTYLILSDYLSELDGFVIEKIPSYFLNSLNRLPFVVVKTRDLPFMYVEFENLFQGFDENGSPVFKTGLQIEKVIELLKNRTVEASY
ncbi:MAG: hypothetical protein ACP5G8_04780 [Athalassotoga sp.]